MLSSFAALVVLCSLPRSLHAQSPSGCGPAPSGGIQPSLASGYQMQVVATGLSSPRGILLDNAGNLLVVEQDRGVISSHVLSEENGCVSIDQSSDITDSEISVS